jgi:hypothetical protein
MHVFNQYQLLLYSFRSILVVADDSDFVYRYIRIYDN